MKTFLETYRVQEKNKKDAKAKAAAEKKEDDKPDGDADSAVGDDAKEIGEDSKDAGDDEQAGKRPRDDADRNSSGAEPAAKKVKADDEPIATPAQEGDSATS